MRVFKGKEREEIINKWLSGIDDPEIEVKPTKQEGRYIVRERKNIKNNCAENASHLRTSSEIKTEKTENVEKTEDAENDEKTNSAENAEQTNSVENASRLRTLSEEPQKIKTNERSLETKFDNNDISLQILNELKILNEQKRIKNEKKAEKKKLKKAIRKEFIKNKVMVEDSDSEQEEQEQQVIYVEQPRPIRTRKRLNLLNRYK